MPTARVLRSVRAWISAVFLTVVVLYPASAQSFDSGVPVPPMPIPKTGAPGEPLDLQSLGAPSLPPGAEPLPDFTIPPLDPALGAGVDTGLPAAGQAFAPSDTVLPPGFELDTLRIGEPDLVVTASLTTDGPPLRSGLVWRVFGAAPGPDGRLPLIAAANGGEASFRVAPGSYLVHCWFGYADRMVRVDVDGKGRRESVVLDAGGVKLQALADDRPLPTDDLFFDVLAMETDARGERTVVAADVKPGDLVRLPAGTYHVVSRYGDVNAVTRAEIQVEPGKLSEVTLYQRAAEVTLKLVGEPGGEAIADTRWSVLTPGGDVVSEGVGAFPSFILAAGDYTAVAKHEDVAYQRVFTVETGDDEEVEVLATEDSVLR